jgi:Protein of unknown function, DUF599
MTDDVFNTTTNAWLAGLLTIAIVLAYEVLQRWYHRGTPQGMARVAHANLREAWFRATTAHSGMELLAVQTLRNSLMSATLTASTATLGLMGTVTLTVSHWADPSTSLHWGWPLVSPRLGMELALMLALFISLACAVMAVRSFSHASFIGAMPAGSTQQQEWLPTGIQHVRKAGELYSWSLRALLTTAPLVASIAHPLAGPIAALCLVLALWRLDRVPSPTHQT